MFRTIPLRAKFLLSTLVVSAGLTAATLWVVSFNVERGIRESIREELRNSVKTYQTFAQQRETTLARSAELLANLPNVRALMTTDDLPTIQNESAEIWKLSGGNLLVLADRRGNVVGLQPKSELYSREQAQDSLRAALEHGESRAWWMSNGHLYEVWLQPIYFGATTRETSVGLLAIGHEIDAGAARAFSNIVSSEIVFRSGDAIVASTLGTLDKHTLFQLRPQASGDTGVQELEIGAERYLTSTVTLSSGEGPRVTISVLKSLDKATAFLNRLNRILLGLGLLSVVAGGALVFLISHTFTKPLSNLVSAVRSLSEGNYEFPLMTGGKDEVGEVTGAFDRMRASIRNTQAEQKQLEDRLRQAHKMEAIGRLAGGVAHDFNNLLTVIRGNSDLLLDRGSMDGGQLRYVEQIQKASDRAVSMTRQLLAFSRMQMLQPRALDLNSVISDMSKMIPRLIGEDIEFSFQPGPELPTVLADPGQIEQVFLNLAVNARDAMPTGGKLTVRTAKAVIGEAEARKRPQMPAGDYVLLAVSDTGSGMDTETKARIFEPFFTTKGIGKGTGLGLATVYGIVKQSGGFIWVESEKGKGATFEIYLPASRKPVTESTERSRVQALPRGTETILVVEDEPAVRELACEFLKAGGYTILEAANGEEALGMAAKHLQPIQLLLSDMIMPRMNGTELAERLLASRAELRVIFMTGYAQFPARDGEMLPMEATFMQKPFSRLSLLEKVREVLAAPPSRLRERKILGPA